MEEERKNRCGISCDGCKWGNCMYLKPTDSHCGKFAIKPWKIYTGEEECPHFTKKI